MYVTSFCRGSHGKSESGPEACRAATAPSWRSFERCAIPAGDDLGEPLQLTVAEAKDHCEAEEGCTAFTFEGEDAEGPRSGSSVWVHFKKAFDCVDAPWVAWRKDLRALSPPALEDSRALSFAAAGSGVALCLLGQVRMLFHTHLALERNLLQVLNPEVFLYGPRGSDREPTPDLHSIQDYVVEERWEVESIRDSLYAETRDASKVIDEYMQVQGNWLGSQCLDPPLRDSRPGSAICSYYSQQKCLQMIQKKERARKQTYQWVVVSRFDFLWLAPHPPLDLLQALVFWIAYPLCLLHWLLKIVMVLVLVSLCCSNAQKTPSCSGGRSLERLAAQLSAPRDTCVYNCMQIHVRNANTLAYRLQTHQLVCVYICNLSVYMCVYICIHVSQHLHVE